MSGILIIEADQGKTVPVHQGSAITIRLDENPTTGYRWDVKEGSNQIIEFQKSEYLIESETETGRGGTRIFRFKAKSIGEETVQLKLRRSWEPDDVFLKEFRIVIFVQKK